MNNEYINKYPEGSWIWRINKKFVLVELARCVDYEYNDWDNDAIEAGIENTDSEIPFYFEYSFLNSGRIDFAIANESGADTIMVLVSSPENIKEKVKYILELATSYDIQKLS